MQANPAAASTATFVTTSGPRSASASLDLAGTWQLREVDGKAACAMAVPGDVHSALIAANIIPDPYWAMNEQLATWVGERDWSIERTFEVSAEMLKAPSVYLNADCLDTHTEIRINDQVVGQTANMFRRFRFEAKPFLKTGTNRIAIAFRSSVRVAKERAEKLPYPVPHMGLEGNAKIPHFNLLRKTQCHGGWDWGISLMVFGVYGDLSLRASSVARIEHLYTKQEHAADCVVVHVTAEVVAPVDGQSQLEVELGTATATVPVKLNKGENTVSAQVTVRNPELWWPNGHGKQALYPLRVAIGDEVMTKRLGLRQVRIINEKDEKGTSMTIEVNGRPIFAKGANWIPSDALPSRQTVATYRDLLESAAQANMNIIRVWGGGQFEHHAFYDICDELGLLIWHDFMFSCALYPADRAFLDEIKAEVSFQVKRLRDHPCIALWCGDNEVVGVLNWFKEAKANRDRYLINYDRLGRVLTECVERCDETRIFWPSSPCAGPGDFSDCWHDDRHGDMHFWSVWHEGKSFDAFYTVTPRFCSEFGFQSFPSLDTVKTYCPPEERNLSAPVMEWHQRNVGGNTRINGTFSTYFRVPQSFDAFLYLSQIQQGLAIKTAVEFWRSRRPTCMGAIYWQLNDVWPVASWASLEYRGKWKQLHYLAKRFYAPVIVTTYQNPTGEVEIWVTNDRAEPVQAQVDCALIGFDGQIVSTEQLRATVPAGSAHLISKRPVDSYAPKEEDRQRRFLHLDLSATVGGETVRHANTHTFTEFKRCTLPLAQVRAATDGFSVTLSTDKPALFVVVNAEGIRGEFDDNAITLLPGKPRKLTFTPKAQTAPADFAKAVSVMHLRQTY